VRVAIVGGPGIGKSTLVRQLGDLVGGLQFLVVLVLHAEGLGPGFALNPGAQPGRDGGVRVRRHVGPTESWQ